MRFNTYLKIKNIQRIVTILLCDIFVLMLSVLLAIILRMNTFGKECVIDYISHYKEIILLILVTCSCISLAQGYVISWRYANYKEYVTLYISTLIGIMFSYVLDGMLLHTENSFLLVDFLTTYVIAVIGLTSVRFGGSMIRQYTSVRNNYSKDAKRRRVLVVGAGDTGYSLIKSMQHEGHMMPVAVIDDDEKKHGMRISGVPIWGDRGLIPTVCKEYKIKEIIVAIPAGDVSDRNDILKICHNTGIKVSTVPSMFELASGKANVSQIHEVTPQELLGREEQLIDGRDIFGYIENKTVLVTGGGGSIGSELCRQISKYSPKRLIIFDIYENSTYELQMELRRKYPYLKLEVLIGSVRDVSRLDDVFSKYKPNVVFHAAAHKHVPLMEDSPNEAIKNNVFGTYNVAEKCSEYEVERFVLISTDKAVNPTNVMGASKRLAEMVVGQFAKEQKKSGGKTVYAAVRFGNVLGSNGSVIPLFKKQIAHGGPVTVTHPDINRFFMTIPEAVQLVMQAGALAHGGEIFILDMGEPVKIVDLAKNLITLSGYTPNVDIKIEFTGLRPGEKMYEELLLDRKRHKATKHDRIFIEPPAEDADLLVSEMCTLRERLSCDVPIYDTMIEWFKEKFSIQ